MFKNRIFFTFVSLLLVFVFMQTSVSAKDEWLAVRSKNFYLIGNANEKDIRKVATKLEQFREVFRQIFSKVNFNSPIPTTVVVFKDAKAYNPYRPLKADGKTEKSVAGYFQPGEDVNYITISTEQNLERAYDIIFHEYTHFLVNNSIGKSNVPPWFNEGLAEYYETFAIENDQKVTLGDLNGSHIALLQQNKLIPFDTFFNIDNYSLHEQSDDGVGLFYAQAWALMHYLIQGNGGARNAQMNKFLDLVMNGTTAKEAFTQAFQTDYATMEKELKKYVEQNTLRVSVATFKNKLSFETEMQTSPLPEADTKAYLGDLLLHTRRLPEAETHLQQALALNPNSSMANVSLGLVKMRQKNFAEAKKYLEKAIQNDTNNYLAFYNYAYVLSREGMTDFGFVSGYDGEQGEKMLTALRKAIQLNPNFAQSYDLFAFISVVRNKDIDEAIKYLGKALQIAPGNQNYLIRAAELYLRKEDYANARRIAQKVAQTAADQEMKVYAQNTLERINSTEAQMNAIKNYKPRQNSEIVTDKPLTEEELARLRDKAMLESLNEIMRRPKADEKRVLGYLTKIDCGEKGMIYTVKVDNQLLKLRSQSFDTVAMMTFNQDIAGNEVGCGVLKKESFGVFIYRSADDAKTKTAGELVSIEFVPANFKFLN